MSQASTGTPSTLAYVTVQDLLWLNMRITRKPCAFDYARLEEATFYQYGYGKSGDIFPQAARFASGFAAKRPFADGNSATALAGCTAFLLLNGYELALGPDGMAIAQSILDGTLGAPRLRELCSATQHAHRDHESCLSEALMLNPEILEVLRGQG